MSERDATQRRHDAAQREHDAKVALAAERQPDAEWVVIPGVNGWVRRQS
jgi:hypothetical protein